MTAGAARARIAAIGGDLVALSGVAGERRGAALLSRIAGEDEPDATLDDLAETPAWLRLSNAAQRRFALRVALLSIAPALATSIDGRWLGAVAAIAGEDEVDWAIGHAPDEGLRAPLPAETLEPHGFALLRGALPTALRGYLAWAPGGDAVSDDRAAGWIATAEAA